MDTLDIEFEYELRKRKILAKIEKLKDEWLTIWENCVGNPDAEALAVRAKLHIQLMETEAADDFDDIERKIEAIRNRINEGAKEGVGDQDAETGG